jgi:hypothetical protein
MCAKFATRNNARRRETKTPRLWKRGALDEGFIECRTGALIASGRDGWHNAVA